MATCVPTAESKTQKEENTATGSKTSDPISLKAEAEAPPEENDAAVGPIEQSQDSSREMCSFGHKLDVFCYSCFKLHCSECEYDVQEHRMIRYQEWTEAKKKLEVTLEELEWLLAQHKSKAVEQRRVTREQVDRLLDGIDDVVNDLKDAVDTEKERIKRNIGSRCSTLTAEIRQRTQGIESSLERAWKILELKSVSTSIMLDFVDSIQNIDSNIFVTRIIPKLTVKQPVILRHLYSNINVKWKTTKIRPEKYIGQSHESPESSLPTPGDKRKRTEQTSAHSLEKEKHLVEDGEKKQLQVILPFKEGEIKKEIGTPGKEPFSLTEEEKGKEIKGKDCKEEQGEIEKEAYRDGEMKEVLAKDAEKEKEDPINEKEVAENGPKLKEELANHVEKETARYHKEETEKESVTEGEERSMPHGLSIYQTLHARKSTSPQSPCKRQKRSPVYTQLSDWTYLISNRSCKHYVALAGIAVDERIITYDGRTLFDEVNGNEIACKINVDTVRFCMIGEDHYAVVLTGGKKMWFLPLDSSLPTYNIPLESYEKPLMTTNTEFVIYSYVSDDVRMIQLIEFDKIPNHQLNTKYPTHHIEGCNNARSITASGDFFNAIRKNTLVVAKAYNYDGVSTAVIAFDLFSGDKLWSVQWNELDKDTTNFDLKVHMTTGGILVQNSYRWVVHMLDESGQQIGKFYEPHLTDLSVNDTGCSIALVSRCNEIKKLAIC